MNSSKRNAAKVVDAVIGLTDNPFKVNAIMNEVSSSTLDFDKVQFNQKGKTLKTINLEGVPAGVLNIQL